MSYGTVDANDLVTKRKQCLYGSTQNIHDCRIRGFFLKGAENACRMAVVAMPCGDNTISRCTVNRFEFSIAIEKYDYKQGIQV